MMFNVHSVNYMSANERNDVMCDVACAANCWQCNSAGAGLCDANQCKQTYTVAEDKTCQRESVKLVAFL